jgi:hypothetical protein
MTRSLTTIAAIAALALAGCGEDEAADTAQEPQPRSTPAVQQTTPEELAAQTQRLAEELARSARQLAEDPDSGTDERLQAAEQRASTLAEQARGALQTSAPDFASALGEANERLAAAAAKLRDAQDADEVGRVLEQDLNVAVDRLSEAADQAPDATGADAGRSLEQAREELRRLSDEVPELAG